MFLRVVVGLGLVVLVTLMLTQVIIPLWRDLPLFPWFRRTSGGGGGGAKRSQPGGRLLEWRDKGEE